MKATIKSEPITGPQLKAIHALLNKGGLNDFKKEFVQAFSNNRTASSRELTKAEAASLISFLKEKVGTDADKDTAAADKMRRKILSLAHEMKWHQAGTDKIEMAHVNEWCIKYGHGKKALDAYTYTELPRLVTQFEAVYKSFLKSSKTKKTNHA